MRAGGSFENVPYQLVKRDTPPPAKKELSDESFVLRLLLLVLSFPNREAKDHSAYG